MDVRLTHNITKTEHTPKMKKGSHAHTNSKEQPDTLEIRKGKQEYNTNISTIYLPPPSHGIETHTSELPTCTHAHSFCFSSPTETTNTPSLHTKNQRSNHPVDDRFLRRRGGLLIDPQWHPPREQTRILTYNAMSPNLLHTAHRLTPQPLGSTLRL